MKTLVVLCIIILCYPCGSMLCIAQSKNPTTSKDDFRPREKVIFEDDFSKDSIESFPAKWELGQCNKVSYSRDAGKFCNVVSDSDGRSLNVSAEPYIEPRIGTKLYLYDSFSLEFDFYFSNPAKSVSVGFFTQEEHNCHLIDVTMGKGHYATYMIFVEGYFPRSYRDEIVYPRPFNHMVWHHYAVSYKNGEIKYYIDQQRFYTMQDCHCLPYGFTIGTYGAVRYRNFRLATGREINPLSKILTGKKLVTHAINFDVNKSTIKPESMDFISQIARFLKENSAVVLEIDGHTDNDGDSTTNVDLSKARANEVRWKLITQGINGDRIIAKGFGATQPIKPNTTKENKAENRRVEFVKL